MIDGALPGPLLRRARRTIGRLGARGLRESYFTTFWLPRGSRPAHALEEAVLGLAAIAAPRRWSGAEWWIGRAYTTDLPIGFHFDEDVKGRGALRHPLVSSVLFFNSVRGGHLAVTDQRPGSGEATALATVKPRANRYAIFDGDRFHGVLDARGRTPGRRLPGPRGRLRVTLVINYWQRRPTDVPEWSTAKALTGLSRQERTNSYELP